MLRKSVSLADAIVETLKADIQAGTILPGAHLHQEDLAKRFAVSRVPVRDALFKLSSEGLVSIEANRGAVVTKLTTDQITEIYDLRLILECDALDRAIKAIKNEDLPAIRRALRLCRWKRMVVIGGRQIMSSTERSIAYQDVLNRWRS